MQIKILYAILFLKGIDGSTIDELAKLTKTSREEIKTNLQELENHLITNNHPVVLKYTNNQVRLTLSKAISEELTSRMDKTITVRLAKTTLETLTIIAYQQPTTKPAIEKIRGVAADYAITKLLEYGLITDIGRSDSLGKPILFVTTNRFLQLFNLQTLEELPAMPKEFEKTVETTKELFLYSTDDE